MAYCVIAFDAAQANHDSVMADLKAGMGGTDPVELQQGLVLLPFKSNSYAATRNLLEPIVATHPTARFMILRLSLGSQIGGWGSAQAYEDARDYVNIDDRRVQPSFEGVRP